MRLRRPRRVRVLVAAGSLLAAVVGAGCLPVRPPPPPPPPPPLIATSPQLFPAFSPQVIDYVSRCDATTPVQVAVNAPAGTTVSVDSQPAAGGSYNTQVTRGVGQEFTIIAQPPSSSPTSYYVRCLPSDFPTWTAQRSGTPQADFYVTASASYPIIFDTNGVPIWWGPKTPTPYANVLPNGDVIWTKSATQPGLPGGVGGAGAEEHRLNGTIVQSMNTVAGNTSGDFHDVLVLPSGDYVMAAAVPKPHVDLSSWTVAGQPAPSDATIVDYVLQELNPNTNPPTVVWSWDTYDHIPPAETAQEWRVTSPSNGSCCFEPYHFNSIEATSGGFVASFRHLDAAYKFDPSASGGPIVWKLGGSPRAESLTVQGDPIFSNGGSFSGQHDARVLSDGSVTLHDNGTNQSRQPRAVHYAIDTTSNPPTATLLAQQTDPLVSFSPCCGSARLLPGGDWVVGWGGSCCLPSGSAQVATGTELTSSGARVFLLQFQGANGIRPTIYRFLPVPSGVLTRDALRAGMDAQYP
jgi:Arylsulfotransferase (ASST)